MLPQTGDRAEKARVHARPPVGVSADSPQSELELDELLEAAAGAGEGAGVVLVEPLLDSLLAEVDELDDAPFDDELDDPRLSFL